MPGPKSDRWIMSRCGGFTAGHFSMGEDDQPQQPMIEPFSPLLVKRSGDAPIVSYGLSSYGYDVRCRHTFLVSARRQLQPKVCDPKAYQPEDMIEIFGPDPVIIPGNGFALTSTLEYLRMPRNVIALCVGKSTYARCGIVANITPLEPGWEGHITIELSNTSPIPAKIYPGEGIAQIIFFESDDDCMVSYADRAGKYMGQTGITLPKV